MADKFIPGPVCDDNCIREAVCIHTRKIVDSCRDKDCIEDLRVYPTRSSQEVIEKAASLKAGKAELIHAYIDVEPLGFNRGFYTVDVRYFYQVTADAYIGAARPVEVIGLAVFDKRVVLFGGESGAKIFSSSMSDGCSNGTGMGANAPVAVVEALDPMVLEIKLLSLQDQYSCESVCAFSEIPDDISNYFAEELVNGGETRRMYVTLGQFSIMRLERDTQLLIPVYDYCLPNKDCSCSNGEEPGTPEVPCEIFRRVSFPVEEFFPEGTIPNDGCRRDCPRC